MAVRVLGDSSADSRLLLTCEHASCDVPPGYGDLGLGREHLRDHIGWDIGAAIVTEELGRRLGAPAVLSRVSRLVVDCNRDLGDEDLMVAESHGVQVPGNASIDDSERCHRLESFYDPYHQAIDCLLEDGAVGLLLSVHSFAPFTPNRAFDVGVLFDDFTDLAQELGARLEAASFSVRENEPYSGYDGLIFSAQSHGRRHGVRYLEIEINNQLLRSDEGACAVAERLAVPIRDLVGQGVGDDRTGEPKCVSF